MTVFEKCRAEFAKKYWKVGSSTRKTVIKALEKVFIENSLMSEFTSFLEFLFGKLRYNIFGNSNYNRDVKSRM